MTAEWAVGALAIGAGCFVMGLAGFGIALVSLALLPHVMPPATAVVVVTLYACIFSLGMTWHLRRHVVVRSMAALVAGSVLGTPLGVWLLASLAAATLSRLIGLTLVLVVVLEWIGVYPPRLPGRRWALAAGSAAGVLGGAVGTPGPPVILYAAAQGWTPTTIKANLQAFFVVNQAVILAGYWWTGLVTADVARVTGVFLAPALLGFLGGALLFERVDHARFRRIVFVLLFVSGAALALRS